MSNNRTCVACSGSCNSCLSPSVCRSCIANTIFNPQTSACFSCISNCQVCINPTSCISCLSGYQLNSDFGCVVAPDESSGFPWWGIVLLILLAVVIIAGIGIYLLIKYSLFVDIACHSREEILLVIWNCKRSRDKHDLD